MKKIFLNNLFVAILAGIVGTIFSGFLIFSLSSVFAAPTQAPPGGNPTFPLQGANGLDGSPGIQGPIGPQGPAGAAPQGTWCGFCGDNNSLNLCEGINVCSSCPAGYTRITFPDAFYGYSWLPEYTCIKQ